MFPHGRTGFVLQIGRPRRLQNKVHFGLTAILHLLCFHSLLLYVGVDCLAKSYLLPKDERQALMRHVELF
jgi:hypothetical protein